jgi:hypothetical protein
MQENDGAKIRSCWRSPQYDFYGAMMRRCWRQRKPISMGAIP